MHFLLLFIVITVFNHSAFAADNVSFLAKQPTWLKLLHIDEETQKSKISSIDFFLSSQKRASAELELSATLEAITTGRVEQRFDALCKFPARYLWLSEQLHQPKLKADLNQCARLQRWVGNHDEVSLILVSGYLGNPASTFGHALLKLQSSSSNQSNKLMDSAINYGAITPENEPTLTYVYKGITGGYKATFLDKYYYTQDLVYSRLESRDMWEYKLNLTQDKARLLIYHIWELIHQEFDYYFLDENCAYQLMDVLELVVDKPLLDRDVFWYVPVEGFRKLESLDAQEKNNGKEGLIKSIIFLPSSQRKLNYQLSLLNTEEFQTMKKLMQEDASVNVKEELLGLSQSAQQRVLDAALTYYNYKLIKSGLKPSKADKELKQQALLTRFELPAQSRRLPNVPHQPSPTQGFAPMSFGLGVGYSDIEKVYTSLHWAAYLQDSTGQNHLRGDELVILDGVLGLLGGQHKVFLEQLDFIRVRKLSNNQMLVRNHGWSWQMGIGIKTEAKDTKSKYDTRVAFGAGKTLALNHGISVYVMTDIAAHTVYPYGRLHPHLGVYFEWDGLKGLGRAGFENREKNSRFKYIWDGEMQYQTGKQSSLVIKYEKAISSTTSLEMRWFW